MKEKNRTEVFETLQSMMSHYCDGCFLYNYLRKSEGKRAAHRFCISQCTVGEKVKEYGKQLS
ncbi:zinc-finger domain-containing protein [Neobacillus sp. SM06]|uniref:zinc-finger domain-containing protein n=1 Tax=Neobacillus sp. SM06 TaxID=3422492 RepID=UPI003D2C7FAA